MLRVTNIQDATIVLLNTINLLIIIFFMVTIYDIVYECTLVLLFLEVSIRFELGES